MSRLLTRARTALALAPLVVVLVGACQSAPAAPALTDPKEILSRSVATLKDVKTFHVDADVSGKVSTSAASGGTAAGAGQLDLAGTKGSLDVDVAGKKLRATGSAPALLNSSIDAIVLPDAIYYKIGGPFATTDKYSKVAASSGDMPSAAPTDPAQAIAEFQAGLDKLPSPPTKLPDEKCGDTDCYHVQVKASAADLSALASAAPTQLTDGDVTVDVWTRKNDLRPAKVALAATSSSMGSLTLTLTMTYDVSINIVAPPADQVQEGAGFQLPSLAP